jgi:hypothetical protein
MAGRQKGLGVLDFDFARPAADGYVPHRPAQQAIDLSAPTQISLVAGDDKHKNATIRGQATQCNATQHCKR